MNYLKYLIENNTYNRGEYDCWTFVQKIYKEEHNKILPDLPIVQTDCESYLTSNINVKVTDKPHKGCIIYFTVKGLEHCGYAIDEKNYIHKSEKQVFISPIPRKATIYEVL